MRRRAMGDDDDQQIGDGDGKTAAIQQINGKRRTARGGGWNDNRTDSKCGVDGRRRTDGRTV